MTNTPVHTIGLTEYLPTVDGSVVRVERVQAQYLMPGDEVVALVDINHVHETPRPECGAFSHRGAFRVYAFDSMSPLTGGGMAGRQHIRDIHLRAEDGTRRTLGYVRPDRELYVLFD